MIRDDLAIASVTITLSTPPTMLISMCRWETGRCSGGQSRRHDGCRAFWGHGAVRRAPLWWLRPGTIAI